VDLFSLEYCFNVTKVVGFVGSFKCRHEYDIKEQKKDLEGEQKREGANGLNCKKT